jgi:hypothetical protein
LTHLIPPAPKLFLLPLREKPVLSDVEGARMMGYPAITLTLTLSRQGRGKRVAQRVWF